MDFGSQQLHQNNTDDRDGHGHGANDFHLELFLGDQRQHGERPYEAEQHFVNACERRMSGFIPAMSHGTCVGDQAGPRCQGREANIGRSASDSESKIKRSGARIENQCGVEQVGFVEQVAALYNV